MTLPEELTPDQAREEVIRLVMNQRAELGEANNKIHELKGAGELAVAELTAARETIERLHAECNHHCTQLAAARERLVEITEPGSIGAFAARDMAVAERDRLRSELEDWRTLSEGNAKEANRLRTQLDAAREALRASLILSQELILELQERCHHSIHTEQLAFVKSELAAISQPPDPESAVFTPKNTNDLLKFGMGLMQSMKEPEIAADEEGKK